MSISCTCELGALLGDLIRHKYVLSKEEIPPASEREATINYKLDSLPV